MTTALTVEERLTALEREVAKLSKRANRDTPEATLSVEERLARLEAFVAKLKRRRAARDERAWKEFDEHPLSEAQAAEFLAIMSERPWNTIPEEGEAYNSGLKIPYETGTS